MLCPRPWALAHGRRVVETPSSVHAAPTPNGLGRAPRANAALLPGDPCTAPPQLVTQEEKDAAARLRAWQKLELDALELYAHMLRQCASGARPPAGKGKGKSKGKMRSKGKGRQAGEAGSEEESQPPAKRRRQQTEGRRSSAAAAAAGLGPRDGEGAAEAGSSKAAHAAAGAGSEKSSKEALQAQVIAASAKGHRAPICGSASMHTSFQPIM